jgi:hypothetical protein
LKERDQFEYLSIDEGYYEMRVKEIGLDVFDWIKLAQDREKWQAVVYTVMNLRVL